MADACNTTSHAIAADGVSQSRCCARLAPTLAGGASGSNDPVAEESGAETAQEPPVDPWRFDNDVLREWIEDLWDRDGSILSIVGTIRQLLDRAVEFASHMSVDATMPVPISLLGPEYVGRIVPTGFTNNAIHRMCTTARDDRKAVSQMHGIDAWNKVVAIEAMLRPLLPLSRGIRPHQRPRTHPTVQVQALCYAELYPGPFGDPDASDDAALRAKQWNCFMHRYKYVCKQHGDVQKHMALRNDHRFRYTPAEHSFCARFDALALRWDEEQQVLANFERTTRCAACDELRPSWVPGFSLRCPDEAFFRLHDNFEQYRGRMLCARCRMPGKDEIEAGTLRFSAANFAFPCLKQLHWAGATPFHGAREEEIALVRLTNPCIQIKVLKMLGTLSKSHSVSLEVHMPALRSSVHRMVPHPPCI